MRFHVPHVRRFLLLLATAGVLWASTLTTAGAGDVLAHPTAPGPGTGNPFVADSESGALVVAAGAIGAAVGTGGRDCRTTGEPARTGADQARSAACGPEGSRSTVSYVWPTGDPVAVLAPFDGSATRYGPGHRGVDLDVRLGDLVRAAADGVVAFAGMVAGRPLLSIDHADGLRTTYEPVDPAVSRGDEVRAGDVVGTLTAGHCPPPGCLHWGARRGSHDYVDPLSLLDDAPRPVRLLPLGGG